MSRIIINNLIVLGICICIGIGALTFFAIINMLAESLIIRQRNDNVFLILQFLVWFPMYFLLARRFLRLSGDNLTDFLSFSLVIIFTTVYVISSRGFNFYPDLMMESPRVFLEQTWLMIQTPSTVLGGVIGERLKLEIIVFCASIIISILLQYLGAIHKLSSLR